ncbi:hypothetical protein HB761_17235 [Vibrio campbellii]|jgi:hypothetical protein|uniref:Uncharacterized protein n=1 Tax=Vibrio campbellii TaxID=680 RepID=A0AAE9SQL3_9VIBR|nr:hypothetical protein [Vibrio campbellii]UTZ28435.1 hypothetical protein HB761_17235 [Vibrio campbellii]UTZ33695.1 hypothetical protein HB762_20710 [Vibrio campbellii]
MIKIEINTLEEAIHIHNIAAINAHKYQNNIIKDHECQQIANVRIWKDIRDQAIKHIEKFAAARDVA